MVVNAVFSSVAPRAERQSYQKTSSLACWNVGDAWACIMSTWESVWFISIVTNKG